MLRCENIAVYVNINPRSLPQGIMQVIATTTAILWSLYCLFVSLVFNVEVMLMKISNK